MASQEHFDILKQGVAVWNAWRDNHAVEVADFSLADLSGMDLRGAHLSDAGLMGANLIVRQRRGLAARPSPAVSSRRAGTHQRPSSALPTKGAGPSR